METVRTRCTSDQSGRQGRLRRGQAESRMQGWTVAALREEMNDLKEMASCESRGTEFRYFT